MATPVPTLAELTQAAGSEEEEVRSRSLQELLALAKKNPHVHPEILRLFQAALASETDAWGVISAVQGIEYIAGVEAGRSAWRRAFNHPNPKIVALAASMVSAPSYGPLLVAMVSQQPEQMVRNAAISALGRLQYTPALALLLDQLKSEQTRWAAIETLNQLGDPRAIPHLEPFLNDQSSLRGQDDRGCTIDVRDITGYALRRLQYLAKTPAARGLPSAQNTQVPAAKIPEKTPVSTPPNFFAYLPLCVAIAEISWISIRSGMLSQPLPPSPRVHELSSTHQLDLLVSIPAATGVVVGITILLRGTAPRRVERIALYLGCIVCAGFLYAFGRKFFS